MNGVVIWKAVYPIPTPQTQGHCSRLPRAQIKTAWPADCSDAGRDADELCASWRRRWMLPSNEADGPGTARKLLLVHHQDCWQVQSRLWRRQPAKGDLGLATGLVGMPRLIKSLRKSAPRLRYGSPGCLDTLDLIKIHSMDALSLEAFPATR